MVHSMDDVGRPLLADSAVRLRHFTMDDVDDITAACQDPEITRWTSIPSPYPREFAELFVSLQDQWRREGSGYHFAIVDVSGGRLSGSIGLDAVLDPPAEVGYWIAPWARRPT